MRVCCTTGVLLVLGGHLYRNSSIVFVEDFSYDINDAQTDIFNSSSLLCVTDKTSCCESNTSGNWYYPNGSVILSNSTNGLFTSRGNDQTVKLNYRGRDFVPGIYRCEIPDQNDVMQSYSVGIYSRNSLNEGMLHKRPPVFLSLCNNVLACILSHKLALPNTL